jgi:hypothetical protein
MTYFPADDLFNSLVAFKAAEREDDPARIADIRGPYEIYYKHKHGRYPEGTWNLRVEESRSGLVWQALSGILDPYPDFAAAYLALGLDKGLDEKTFVQELRALNKSWEKYIELAGLATDHTHTNMRKTFMRVDCAQCSMLAAIACRDEALNTMFVKDLLPLKNPNDRMAFLKEQGLLPLLDTMIPDQKLELI